MKYPIIQLDTNELLSETLGWPPEMFGHYVKLLMVLWRAPNQCIPYEDAKIANILSITKHRWKTRIAPYLCDRFEIENGVMSHQTVTKTFQKIKEKSQKNSNSGKIGAFAKALKSFIEAQANAERPLEQLILILRKRIDKSILAPSAEDDEFFDDEVIKQYLWGSLKNALMAKAGVSDERSRRCIGKWLSMLNGQALNLTILLSFMLGQDNIDPIGAIQRQVMNLLNQNAIADQIDDAFDQAMASMG